MKTIVIFYSLEGNTKEAAEQIAQKMDSAILELKPEKEIPGSGALKFMKGGMQALFGNCPKLKPLDFDKDAYDQIILGTPIWAGECAPAIRSFLKQYPVSDKVKAVFTTSGGGDNDKCIAWIKKKLPNLKETVALADRNNPISEKNQEKIDEFVEKIVNGK